MPATVKVNNVFKSSYHQVKINGTWKSVPQIYIKQNNQWKPLYSYSWETSKWSNCSASCGGGIQTRTVKCKRNDGIVVDDYICNIFAGTKPATQSTCNTQPCIKCEYDLYHTLWGYNNWMDHSNNTCSQTVFSDVYITINDNQICTRCTSYTSTSVVIDGIEYSRGKKRDYPQWGNNCLNHYEVCY